MATATTQATRDTELARILADHNATTCPECGNAIGWGDIAWNNAGTLAGTPFATIEIQCAACDTEIAHIESWYPGIDGQDELLYVLDKDWED